MFKYLQETFSKKTRQKDKDILDESEKLMWATKRAGILNKFTTSEKLSIATSFLSGGEMSK